jgi:uncharacterized protein
MRAGRAVSMMLLAVLLGSFSGVAAKAESASAFSAADAMRSVAENLVRPGYGRLAISAEQLAERMQALCATPSEAAHNAAKVAFAATAIDWGRMEFFRSGPVMAENRVERMLFFPDRKGTGLKQVQALIEGGAANDSTSVPDAAALAKRSVALQGLGALDYVLAGAGSEALSTAAPRRCAIGVSIAKAIATIPAELAAEWAAGGETERLWRSPGVDSPFARDQREATNLLLGTIIHGLEAVRDLRLLPVLGQDGAPDKPKSGLFWRSGLTMAMVTANLEAARDMFERSGLATALPADEANLAATVRFAFRQSINTAKALNGPLEAVLAAPAKREKLAYLALSVKQLITHLDAEFAPAAGLAAGFSFGDGD